MNFSSVDVIWTLLGAALVYFMQAGFAMCEAGLTRAKNTGNILMKNMMDFCIGTPAFWLVGFGLMFGGSGAFIGKLDPLIRGSYQFGSLPTWCFVIFQTVFCATSATIVSGSMAERTNFKAYCLYSAMISLIVYPISGHWIWGGGWFLSLASMILPEVLPYIWSAVSLPVSVQKSLVLVLANMIKTENQKQSPVIISPLPHSVFSFSGSAGSDLTEQAQLQCQLTPILQKPVWYT